MIRPGSKDSQNYDNNSQKVYPQPIDENMIHNMDSMDSMIGRIFNSISSLKAAYIQLQEAHTPYDPDKIQTADKLVVDELTRLSELKHNCREKNPKPIAASPQDSRLLSEIQEQQNLLKTYEVMVKKFQSQIQNRDTEISHLHADTATFRVQNDHNYYSDEEPPEDYKRRLVTIIEEYFSTGDATQMASELKELGGDDNHHFFVKKLVSMAMDRHDKEKEMVSVLLSCLYGDVVSSTQIKLGFLMLLQAVDDLAVDIPDAVDVLALFIARAVVDEVLPPAFLNMTKRSLTSLQREWRLYRLQRRAIFQHPTKQS